ncbi:MAG: Mur ligase domain-containing protein [Phascolarctobacterium faecium]
MLKGLQNIHFIGIGGAGMSAIAHVLLKRGYQVSGSDLNAGHMGAKLAQEGALASWVMLTSGRRCRRSYPVLSIKITPN